MLTPSDYLTLFHTCNVSTEPRKVKELDYVCRVALTHHGLYQTVTHFTGVPWVLIAALHFRESGQNFKTHLHNGDPLEARTVHEPRGRPEKGQPPFLWVESATDAFEHVWRPKQWDVPGSLEFLERFNGLGYQKHGVSSPYLWDYTDKYTKGLFVADGRFDPEKVERRPGCVAIVKTLAMKGITLDFTLLESGGNSLH